MTQPNSPAAVTINMIEPVVAAGYRVIAPDLIGFGRSDKPVNREDYTYNRHVGWVRSLLLDHLDLRDITLICQDWGGLIGLRLAAIHPDRFSRLVIANTGLPSTTSVPDEVSEMLGGFWDKVPVPKVEEVMEQISSGAPGGFLYWVKYCAETPEFSVRDVFGMLMGIEGPELDGYCAPFPGEAYLQGARKFPSSVPLLPHHKQDRLKNDEHWKVLEAFDKPVLTAFSDNDPVTRGGEVPFLKRIEGAQNVNHVTIKGAGHFLQDDGAKELSEAVIDFIAAHP